MKCAIVSTIAGTLIVLGVLFGQARGMPPVQCSLNLLNEVPPQVRKVCDALVTIDDLRTAMENYIDDKAPVVRENLPVPKGMVKRQDVDHVFLRFGRRR